MKRAALIPQAGFLAVLLASPALAQTKPVVQSDAPNPAGSAYSIVFVAEGWTADEQDQFFTEAKAAANLVTTDESAAPLRARKPMNFHYVFVPSNAPASYSATPNDSACKTTVGSNGLISADDGAADTIASAAPDVDDVIIFIKFPDGAGWQRANSDVPLGHGGRTRIPHDSTDALIHELGHSIVGLGDEYADIQGPPPDDASRSDVAMFPNLTLESTGARWAQYYQGAVLGGGRYTEGVWHPTTACRMNQSTSEDFCVVCRAAIAGDPNPKLVEPVHVAAKNDVVSWQPDGALPPLWRLTVWPSGNGAPVFNGWVEPQDTSYSLADLPPGKYSVEVSAASLGGTSAMTTLEATVTAPPPSTTPPPSGTAPSATAPGAVAPASSATVSTVATTPGVIGALGSSN